MTAPSGGLRPRKVSRLAGILAVGVLTAMSTVSASAQTDPSAPVSTASNNGPDDWDVSAGSLPVAIQASIPPVLPIDVGTGIGFAGVEASSLPLVLASVGPVYAPVIDALGLLGGTGAVPGILLKLIPSLLLGGPTIFGLPPLPIDPGLLPQPPPIPFPSPELPVVQCTANFPGDPREVTCGGPQQSAFGSRVRALSGTARVEGDASDTDTLDATASVRGAGLEPDAGATIAPISAGVLNATTSVRTEGQAIEAGTSVEVSGIDLLAGLIQVDAVRTSVAGSLTGRPGEAAVNIQPCEVAGVRIAGIPVQLGADGATLDTTGVPLPLGDLLGELAGLVGQLTQLEEPLRQLSIPIDVGRVTIRALPPQAPVVADDGTRIEARATCLEVTYTIAASGTSIRLGIGQSSLSMSAFRSDGSGSGPPSGSIDGGSPIAGPPIGVGGPPDLGPLPAPVVTPVAPEPGSGAPPPSSTPVLRTVAVQAPDWLPVLLAMFAASMMSLVSVRARRATWRGAA